jgi:hypothetical protein
MAQRGKEKSSEAPISCRRKWNFTVKPRFDLGVFLGVFGEGPAADRDIRDFAEVFIWKQAAIKNEFPQRIGMRGSSGEGRASRFCPRMTVSLIRVAASQTCVLLPSQPRKWLILIHSRRSSFPRLEWRRLTIQ